MRILLPRGRQNRLMEQILQKISAEQAAKLCGFSERTIRDWRREKFLMQKNAMELLCEKTGILLPKHFEEKDDYWYADPHKGAAASIKKYGRVGALKTIKRKNGMNGGIIKENSKIMVVS